MRALLAVLFLLGTLARPALADDASPSRSFGDDDKANQELAKELDAYHKQAQEALQKIEGLTKAAPVSQERIDATKARALQLANDDRFLGAAKELWASPKRDTMLIAQGVWFLLLMIFKAWRLSKAQHWFRKMLIGGACSFLRWAGILYVIPLAVLGEPFWIFTGTLWKVLVLGG